MSTLREQKDVEKVLRHPVEAVRGDARAIAELTGVQTTPKRLQGFSEEVCRREQALRVLEGQGWTRGGEQLLLGRSMWRRHTAHRNPQLSRSLDDVFGRLRPQGSPLPNPSLGPRCLGPR